jgi:hypothetical protein
MGKKFLLSAFVVLFITGCGGGGGDINIEPTTIDNSVNDSNNTNVGGGDNPDDICASYTNSGGQLIQGKADSNGNCSYSASFLDAGNPLTVDMTIPALENGGAHLFEGSLFVGRNYDNDADMAAAGISQGGDGPTLTVEAGATVAFATSSDFVIINRGSQIFAVGTADAPITFTSISDVNGTVGAEDVQQWGGMVINGFGVTNKCEYTGNRGESGFSTSDCHVAAEGAAGLDTSHYGGDNDEDSSGRLEYFITKHTGAQVANGDELNGISFGGVGSNTIVSNLQVYSTFDDGIEMFGGSVNFENFVGVYARDDTIDIDEGYNGSITNALVIQSETDGNHCIESDGLGSFSSLTSEEVEAKIAQGLQSAPTITNLTCVVSPNGADTATHDPGAGWRFREGIFMNISDSMVISSPGVDSSDNNYCLRIDNRSAVAAEDGDLVMTSNILACQDQDRGDTIGGLSPAAWASANGNQFATISAVTDPTANADTGLVLLEGTPPIYSAEFSAMVVDDAAPTVPAPASGRIGAALQSADWAQGWTYGIFDGSRAQPLWFE